MECAIRLPLRNVPSPSGTVLGDLHLPKANSVDSRNPFQSAFLKLMKVLSVGSTKSISQVSVCTIA